MIRRTALLPLLKPQSLKSQKLRLQLRQMLLTLKRKPECVELYLFHVVATSSSFCPFLLRDAISHPREGHRLFDKCIWQEGAMFKPNF